MKNHLHLVHVSQATYSEITAVHNMPVSHYPNHSLGLTYAQIQEVGVKILHCNIPAWNSITSRNLSQSCLTWLFERRTRKQFPVCDLVKMFNRWVWCLKNLGRPSILHSKSNTEIFLSSTAFPSPNKPHFPQSYYSNYSFLTVNLKETYHTRRSVFNADIGKVL